MRFILRNFLIKDFDVYSNYKIRQIGTFYIRFNLNDENTIPTNSCQDIT